VDTDRIMLKGIILVTLTLYTCFNVFRTQLKTLAGRLCESIRVHMESHDHTIQIQ
jgi:hypothetical protein